jgi:very-short-patch-repair endonuclease/type I restriction-modification system DNA methylase subunit
MNIFDVAGISLNANRSVSVPRIPLLAQKVVKAARERIAFAPDEAQLKAASQYAKNIRNDKFLDQKEEAIRPIFIDEILVRVLGYQRHQAGQTYTLKDEEKAARGSVDVALGHFHTDGTKHIAAPFELKGPKTKDLDAIMPGRGKSPVQQVWEYANDMPNSRWVLVSNCVEIRLYGYGRGREAYEVFDLSRIDEPEQLARLWMILSAKSLLDGGTQKLLEDTDKALKDITNVLYAEYKELRKKLINFLVNTAETPKLNSIQAIESAQKILDRILFVAFAQSTDLLPNDLLARAINARNEFNPIQIWLNFRKLFEAIDKGSDRLLIPPYNGGLFAPDSNIDQIIIPDPLSIDLANLGIWDFKSEVPVTVLGHIFEQSITDLEALKAEALGQAPPASSKRKREGVVYTPEMITSFLVEQTLNKTLNERLDALKLEYGWDFEPTEDQERVIWPLYLQVLRGLTIVDPACGSGAFLIAAYDALYIEYRRVTERLAALNMPVAFDFVDEIVTKNLYGVDLNAESVEITRLSLWLKTARRDHQLQNLEATIKTGNSLIEDKAFTPRPFNWQQAYPNVFEQKNVEERGFDLVLGNPPYVRQEFLKEVKPYLEKKYVVSHGAVDLYAYFFERGMGLLKEGGRLGYISSSTFFRTGSGENLRRFLSGVTLETIVDFGDLQVFEGVTTYPAILTMRKSDTPHPSFSNEKPTLSRKREKEESQPPVALPSPLPLRERVAAKLTGEGLLNKIIPSPLEGEGDPKDRMRGKEPIKKRDQDISPEKQAILQQYAKDMRASQAPAEKELWALLRGRRFSGYKFRRQVRVGHYIADFMCFEQQLIVEADGSQHNTSLRDEARDAWLISQGFRVRRFWNEQIFNDQNMVCDTIWADLQGLTSDLEVSLDTPQPSASLPPSPSRGEGLAPVALPSPLPLRERVPDRAGEGLKTNQIAYYKLKNTIPTDLNREFTESHLIMPQGRLGSGAWRLEDDELASLRAKITTGRKTLGEVYGAPLYGIKTGLNEAFIIDRATRDRLVKADPKSAELLKPFLKGENVKRWRVESDDLWLIFTRQGTDIEQYPAIKQHLLQFKDRLEPKPKNLPEDQTWLGRKAGSYKWYEMQDTVAYWKKFLQPKLSYGHFADKRNFAFDEGNYFSNDKTYIIPNAPLELAAMLNSNLYWAILQGLCPAVRGGFYELRIIYVQTIPIPIIPPAQSARLTTLAEICTNAAQKRLKIQTAFQTSLGTLATLTKTKLSTKLQNFWELDFKTLLTELKKSFGIDLPTKKHAEWQDFLSETSAKIHALNHDIAVAENEINQIVYELFELTTDEIKLLEASLG